MGLAGLWEMSGVKDFSYSVINEISGANNEVEKRRLGRGLGYHIKYRLLVFNSIFNIKF